MDVSDQVYDSAALCQGKGPTVPTGQEVGWTSRADPNAPKKGKDLFHLQEVLGHQVHRLVIILSSQSQLKPYRKTLNP